MNRREGLRGIVDVLIGGKRTAKFAVEPAELLVERSVCRQTLGAVIDLGKDVGGCYRDRLDLTVRRRLFEKTLEHIRSNQPASHRIEKPPQPIATPQPAK